MEKNLKVTPWPWPWSDNAQYRTRPSYFYILQCVEVSSQLNHYFLSYRVHTHTPTHTNTNSFIPDMANHLKWLIYNWYGIPVVEYLVLCSYPISHLVQHQWSKPQHVSAQTQYKPHQVMLWLTPLLLPRHNVSRIRWHCCLLPCYCPDTM